MNSAMYKDLGDKVATIPSPAVQRLAPSIQPTNFKGVASYNWLDEPQTNTPAMIVPGSPSIWSPPPLPFSLIRDRQRGDTQFVNQNAYRMEHSSAMAALVVAVKAYDPSFAFADVDFALHRNDLLKLSTAGNETGRGAKDFRIDLELVGKTIILNRWEEQTVAEAGLGYGDSFWRETTKDAPEWGGRKVSGSHRICSFELGGFKFLEGFAVDARLPPNTSPTRSATSNQPLDELMAAVSLSSSGSSGAESVSQDPSTGIKVVHRGSLAPQSSIVEIKTRRLFPGQVYDVSECIHALVFSQTSHLFVGRHNRGRFDHIFTFDLQHLGTEQRMIKSDIHKAIELLKSVKEALLKVGEGKKMCLVFSGGRFTLYKNEGGVGLPKELKEYFE